MLRRIQDKIKVSGRKVAVLDDDPTGTQTVNNVLVLTEWSVEALQHALARDETVFYILTNSRSYPAEQAVSMNREIAENLAAAARRLDQDLDVVSRSDSTLRGHYPGEVQALRSVLEDRLGITYDGEIIAPFFLEGGRFTVHDIHWVQEGDWLIPATQTEYAQDPIFGYHHSNLREWVEEKTCGQVTADSVVSVALDLIRAKGPSAVAAVLRAVTGGQSVIVNAVTYRDMEVFLLGLLEAEEEGRRFLFRTAASFVKVRGGIEDRGLLTSRELFPHRAPTNAGGLIIIGSHVQKTTDQLQLACELDKLVSIELSVPGILNSQTRQTETKNV
ncbi:MAG: hydroxyacid dehydrogenase, partial [Anaerolineae bacterium]|nr:hydroxyacid dehydrogenase [Anaerolineae bacterium]